MSITVNTNVQSLFSQRALGKNTMNMQKSLEKLSTGFRINRAGDDAAGLSISEGLTSEINGLNKAKQNIGDAISMVQTAEGGLSVIQDNVQRIRELVVQSQNGTNSRDELNSIQREINERVTTIDDIAKATQFNGNNLLKAGETGHGNKTIQTGANNGESLTVTFAAGTAAGIDVDISVTTAGSIGEGTTFALDDLKVTDNNAASVGGQAAPGTGTSAATTTPLDDLDTMIGNLSRMRSYLGAVQNSLESRSEYVDVAIENASASRSRIRDVDVASESSVMLKNQILQQSAASMLSQANSTPQIAMNLLP